jgi:hypothetical protein
MLCQITGDRSDGPPSKYTFPMPEYVALMSPAERQTWMRANNVVPSIQGGAYSMFEMMQPFQMSAAGSTFTAVTAASKTALTPDTLMTVPANIFSFVGKRLWCHYAGVETNVITTPGTYTFTLNWGGSAGTVLQTTGAIAPSAVVNTNTLWYADFYIVCRATGGLTTSLTLNCHGVVWSPSWLVPTTQAIYGVNFAPPNTGTPGTALADVASLNGTTSQALTLAVTPTVTTGSIALVDGWIVSMN